MIKKWLSEASTTEVNALLGCFASWGFLGMFFLSAAPNSGQSGGVLFLMAYLPTAAISASIAYATSTTTKDKRAKGWLRAVSLVTALPLALYSGFGFVSFILEIIHAKL